MPTLTDEERDAAEPLAADRPCWYVSLGGEDMSKFQIGLTGTAYARMLFVPLPMRYEVVKFGERKALEPVPPSTGKRFYLSVATFCDQHLLIEGKIK